MKHSVFIFLLFIFVSCAKSNKENAFNLQTKSANINNATLQEENEIQIPKPKIRTVEIASIEYASGVLSSDVAVLKAKIVEGLSNRKNIRVIDRSRLEDVQNEHQKQQSLWASDENLAEVGKQYNANAYVYLDAISKTQIQVTIEDINTFQQVIKLVDMSNVSEISSWDLSILSL